MSWFVIGLVILFLVLEFKTSRPDGTLVKGVHPVRRMLWAIIPNRDGGVVYFDRKIRAENLEAYLEKSKARFGGDITHAGVAALNIGLAENPRMNQFVAGGRLYERKGRHVTFSMKRKAMDKKAKLAVVKLQIGDGETFEELCERINAKVNHQRSGKRTSEDKEYDLFDLLSPTLLRVANKLLRLLDYFNILPKAFIEPDGMYTSAVLANLGSLGMGPGYHHLYEHGTSPLFLMFGQITEEPVVEDGEVVVGRVLHIRFSYDERIADGLTARFGIESVARVLSDPAHWLGCIEEDGSDRRPMWPHGEAIDTGDAS